MGGRMGAGLGGVAAGVGNPALVRAQLSFAAAAAAEWAFTVAITVVAYRDGGATAVGLVALARMVPAALITPAVGALTDRVRREQVLVAASLACAGFIALGGLALVVEAPLLLVYGCAVAATIAITPYRGAHSALLPSLCQTGEQLTAVNVVRGLVESLSMLLGPLGAALLLTLGSPTVAFFACATTSVLSAVAVLGLRYDPPPRALAVASSLRVELVEGLQAVRADGDVALIFLLVGVQTFVRGALSVLIAVLAFDVLRIGEDGIGLLTAAIGVGAVVGSLGAGVLVGRSLPRSFCLSVALWGGPLLLVALVPDRTVALVVLGVIGVANAVLDVGLYTMLSRLAPDALLGRVIGALEAFASLTVGLGSVLAPVLLAVAPDRVALVVVGVLGPLAALLGWRRLVRLEARLAVRDEEVAALRAVSLLGPLPFPTIEGLADRAEPLTVTAGEVVVREGEIGRRYYVVVSGRASASVAGRLLSQMGPGDGFGEIALLRDTPRTATVTAETDLVLLGISRGDFMVAVAGFDAAASAASVVVAERLARSDPRPPLGG